MLPLTRSHAQTAATCTFTQGTAGSCPLNISLSSKLTFAQVGGVLSLVASGGKCSGTEDTADFGVSQNPYAITYNGTAVASSHDVCVQATARGYATAYLQLAIAVNPAPQQPSKPPPSQPPPSQPPPAQPPGSASLTPPPGAQAAGFTTIAMNMDFTNATQSSFDGNTFDAQTLSNWLDCAGASNPVWWLTPAWGPATPCSRVFITNDGGKRVLDLQFQPADANTGSAATEIDTWTVNEPADTGHDFPQGGQYVEFTFRVTPMTTQVCQGCGAGVGDVWSWYSKGGVVEWDFLELAANGFGYSSCHDWGGTSNCSSPNAWGFMDYTQYHTYALRITSDGTNMDQCGYFDGAFQGCGGEFTPPSGTAATQQRGYMRVTLGPYNGSNTPPPGNMDLMLQSLRVWTCRDWKTSPCTSTVLNGSP